MIVVIDYKVGNVKSVCNAFRHIGCEVELSSSAEVIKGASGLVLPGVAAFGYAKAALGKAGNYVVESAAEGKALLGICVGYQLLYERSFEYGEHEGLGLIKGDVVGLPEKERVPHMGWNLVEAEGEMDLFSGSGEARHFYFCHSFYSKCSDSSAKVAYTDYGFSLPAAVQKGSIMGTQFHPEKSGPAGLSVLRNFARVCGEVAGC